MNELRPIFNGNLEDINQITLQQAMNGLGNVFVDTLGLRIDALDGVTLEQVQAVVDAHDPNILTNEQQQEIDDTLSFDDLLAIATSGIAQIDNDIIDLNNAASLAEAKPILQNTLNRQRKTIKALVGIVRKLR